MPDCAPWPRRRQASWRLRKGRSGGSLPRGVAPGIAQIGAAGAGCAPGSDGELRMKHAVVIGGGHNGLVCAWYLARAGHKVTVLEKREIVGGAAVTEEFHPGFRNSMASYTVSLLNPKVIADLDLARHGLEIVERRMGNFLPLPDGRALEAGPGRTRQSVAQFFERDAAALDGYERMLENAASVLRDLLLVTPAQRHRRQLAVGGAGPSEGGVAGPAVFAIVARCAPRRARSLHLFGGRDPRSLVRK